MSFSSVSCDDEEIKNEKGKEYVSNVGNKTLGEVERSDYDTIVKNPFQSDHRQERNIESINNDSNKASYDHLDEQENTTSNKTSLTEDESDTKLVEGLDTLQLNETFPFNLKKEDCDLWFKTKTGMVGFPFDYVKWISKELHTMCTGEGVSGERTIVELDISEESLIHVISFFHPKHFTPLKGTYFLIGIIMHMKI